MAVMLQFDQIIGHEAKQQLSGFRGKVKHVFPQAPTKGERPGFQQGVVITIGNGEVIAKLYDRDNLKGQFVGKDIVIVPGKDGRGQIGGVRYNPWTNQEGVVKHYIDVNTAAEVTIGGVDPWSNAPAAAAPSAGQPAPARQSSAPAGCHTRWSTFLPAHSQVVAAALDEAMKVCQSRQEAIGALCGTGFTTEDVRCISNAMIVAGEKHGLSTPPPQAAAPAPQPSRPAPPQPPPVPEPPVDTHDGGDHPNEDADEIPF